MGMESSTALEIGMESWVRLNTDDPRARSVQGKKQEFSVVDANVDHGIWLENIKGPCPDALGRGLTSATASQECATPWLSWVYEKNAIRPDKLKPIRPKPSIFPQDIELAHQVPQRLDPLHRLAHGAGTR